jgi:hypothetical protein
MLSDLDRKRSMRDPKLRPANLSMTEITQKIVANPGKILKTYGLSPYSVKMRSKSNRASQLATSRLP